MAGNPIGFQRCVNADNTRGIVSNKMDELDVFLPAILMCMRFR